MDEKHQNYLLVGQEDRQAESQKIPRKTSPLSRFVKSPIFQCVHIALLLALFARTISLYLPNLWSRHDCSSRMGLNADLVAHCNDLIAPPEGYYTSRLGRLTTALSVNDDHLPVAWVAEPGPSAEFFLGAFGAADWSLSERPFLVAITPSNDASNLANITLVTPEFEKLRAQEIHLPEEVAERVHWASWQEDESPYEVLIHALDGRAGDVLVDDMVRSFIITGTKDAAKADAGLTVRGDEMNNSPASKVQEDVWLIRERKDEREIGLLKCANQMTIHAIRQTRARMHFGISESETRTILAEEMAATGLKGGDGLVLFGEDAALPHGSASDRRLGRHDLVLIDAGGKWGGLVSDITRTFPLPHSEIPKAHQDLFETVRKAQYAPYELLLSSNTSQSPQLGHLDRAARSVVSSYMLSDVQPNSGADFSFFTHRLGHGIGLEGHERPYLVPGQVGRKEARSGHVFSLEPGVYIPRHDLGKEYARGLNGVGVRLEDCFVITEDEQGNLGGQWLSGPVRKFGEV